jgi:hypothetical protein
MAQITIVDQSNEGLPAIIFKDGAGVGVANIDGQVQLPNGKYVAKVIGYADTPFEVNGDAYVLMKPVEVSATSKTIEITAKATTWKKWVKLGAIGLIIFGVVKFFTIKK